MEALPPKFDDEPGASSQTSTNRSTVYRAFESGLMGLNAIGSVWIFVLMLLICADVVARSGFNHPIDGVTDIAAFSIIGIVFLQIGATVHKKRMTKGDVLLEIISARSVKAGAIFESIFLLVGAVMFGLIVSATWPAFMQAINRKQFFGVEGVFTFPTWPIWGIIVLGAAMVVVTYLVQIGDLLRGAFRNERGVAS